MLGSPALRQRQEVPIGVFEPCSLGGARRPPDPHVVLLQERIPLKGNAAFRESLYGVPNTWYVPAEGCKRVWLYLFDLLDPELNAITVERDGELVIAFDCNGVQLRIQKVEKVQPHPFTALG